MGLFLGHRKIKSCHQEASFWQTQSLWMVSYHPGAFPFKVGAEAMIQSVRPPPLLVRASPEMGLLPRDLICSPRVSSTSMSRLPLPGRVQIQLMALRCESGSRASKMVLNLNLMCTFGSRCGARGNVGSRGASTCSLLGHCPASSEEPLH